MTHFLKDRLKSLGHALHGLRLLAGAGPNMQINFLAVIAVTAAGIGFGITPIEWAIVTLCGVVVIAGETINTALERLIDHLHPSRHPEIGKIKDLAAAASLILSIGAAIAGFLIFGKYVAAVLNG